MSERITRTPAGLSVPDNARIPFSEGDGTGPDIWRAARRVLDAAIAQSYGGRRRIDWVPVLAGERAFAETGDWLPPETEEAFRTHMVGIKGPLTTPVGGGIRSLNVALRQKLDLYVCLRPVRWFAGVPSPVKRSDLVDMVVFRENTEDVYAGLEVKEGSEEARELADFLKRSFGWSIREDAGRDIANPCSVILSGTLMLDYLGWREAASSIEAAVTAAIAGKAVTYDFARLMDGATQVSTS